MTRPTAAPTLSPRALNRALLERQLLLRRAGLAVPAALEHLVGLQAQAPKPPYLGLWTRLENFEPERLAWLLRDRRAVRIALMRSTIHLVTAEDCLLLRPVVQPVLDRALQRGQFGRSPGAGELEELAATGRALLDARPRTASELGALLQRRWPHDEPAVLANAVRALLPLVQIPPRGLWGLSGPAAHTTTDRWLGRPLAADSSPVALVLRYLRAFGPATVADVQAWSGLTRLRSLVPALRAQLRTFRDERGAELFDVVDGPLPDPDTPAPVRFLPEYDNLLLSHADRTRVIPDRHRRRIASRNGQVPGAVLVDGFLHGTWRVVRERRTAVLEVEPFAPLAAADRHALAEEGAALLALTAGETAARDVRVLDIAADQPAGMTGSRT